MQPGRQETHIHQEDVIDLKVLFNSLIARRFLIAGLTGFITLLAILYALNLEPTYQASSSFTSPSKSSVTVINTLNLKNEVNTANEANLTNEVNKTNEKNETKNTIFYNFLTHLSSRDLQKKVFIEGDFATMFNTGFEATDSITISSPNMSEENYSYERPYTVTIEGGNPEAISKYLNSLVQLANSKTINEYATLLRLKITNRLEAISSQRGLLLNQASQERLNQIKRIKEEDGQKIREINVQIDMARYRAKEDRLNKVVVLKESIMLAKSLGVLENNLKLISNDFDNPDLKIVSDNPDLNIASVNRKSLPDWYLYGEKALMQKVALLENRTNDDPFIPEIVTLKNKLNEIQNNNLLKTLETRYDDSPFIAEIVKLDVEKLELRSRIVDLSGVNAMKLSQISIPQKSPIKPNKRLIVLLAFIGSFMISILLVLIMASFKPNKKAPA